MSKMLRAVQKPVCLMFGHDWEYFGKRRKCRACGKRQVRNDKWHEWEAP